MGVNPNYEGFMTKLQQDNPTLYAEIRALELDPEASVSAMAKRIYNLLLKDLE